MYLLTTHGVMHKAPNISFPWIFEVLKLKSHIVSISNLTILKGLLVMNYSLLVKGM